MKFDDKYFKDFTFTKEQVRKNFENALYLGGRVCQDHY